MVRRIVGQGRNGGVSGHGARFRSPTAICVAAVAALLVFASTAFASGEFEPNDSFITATGPIVAGTTYSGTYETSNDSDYFFFYLPQITQLQFRTTNSTPKEVSLCSAIYHQLPSGTNTVSGGSLSVEGGESASGAVTLEPGKYYYVLGCPGTIGKTYSFSLNPPGVTSTYEPFAQACAAAHPPVVSAAEALNKARAKLTHAKQRLAEGRRWKPKRKRLVRANIAHLKQLAESIRDEFC